MGETSYTALEGKVCVITLKELAGTNCQWCLTSMPKELALAATYREAERSGIGGIYQVHFYFLVKSSEEANVELEFEMVRISDPTDKVKSCSVKVHIIPADSDDFASLDVVAQVENMDAEACLKYGYPCGGKDDPQTVMYGFPCRDKDDPQTVMYGFPCRGKDDPQTVMYGFPCRGKDDPRTVMYGYPCGVQDGQQMLKYGYPFGV